MHTALPRIAIFAAAAALFAAAHAQQLPAAPLRAQPVRLVAFDGLWCGTGLLHEFSLRLTQQERDVQGTLARRDRVRQIEGRVDGGTLRTQETKVGSLVLEREGDELRITGGEGPIALARGATFQRTAAGSCSG